MGSKSISYEPWLEEFKKGKEEVVGTFESGAFALHTVRRFIDKKSNTLWETAITYTGRLVVRSGNISPDGIQVEWANWETKHNVKIDG